MAQEEDENADRRREEREALEAFYGEKVSGPPDGPWRICLGGRGAVLELELPSDYPSSAGPRPGVVAPGVPPGDLRALEAELANLFESDMEAAILMAEHARDALGVDDDDEEEQSPAAPSPPQPPASNPACYACLRTHHLLDHKPDNLLRTAGRKHGLVGLYKFGTPGIAVAWADDPSAFKGFADTLRAAMPQKKFEVVLERPWEGPGLPFVGWEAAGSAAELKAALETAGAPPEDYFLVLGLDPPSAKPASRPSKGPKR